MFKKIAVLMLTALITGCGYHLRGGAQIDLDKIYLEGGSGQLRDEFMKAVKSSSSTLAKSPEEASVVIIVLDDSMRTRVLSLSERGRSNELEFDYRLEFELKKAGKTMLSGEPIKIRREYYNDQIDVNAKSNEANIIRNEIYQQAVFNLVDRARLLLSANTK
ncbi:MAG: LPS-assembly lipoprotein LptE [Gammaproteobacteria bacterium]